MSSFYLLGPLSGSGPVSCACPADRRDVTILEDGFGPGSCSNIEAFPSSRSTRRPQSDRRGGVALVARAVLLWCTIRHMIPRTRSSLCSPRAKELFVELAPHLAGLRPDRHTELKVFMTTPRSAISRTTETIPQTG